ncbi:hypothetical protein [Lichenifustis flavocetrariae]|uniref:VPLPA-CTERM sorting domain-containing protein n=1 Tax=Lichenifustis flavocetrariae TaxID=2949735 RepID=A0AA41ZAB4_9HYPH|nr:hypothetical protein [Lichenifustis flavocetrariae]MCW6513180.1 hypothetical protein [Lichenifustis flavocetrariae]
MKHAAVMAGLALSLMSGTAKAAYIVNIDQVGTNVVATGSGSLDLSTFSFIDNGGSGPTVNASIGSLELGTYTDPKMRYAGSINGPGSFGTGSDFYPDITSGSLVGINAQINTLVVPNGYVSGDPLGTSVDIFSNNTFATLGLSQGTYTYLFAGSGESTDTFTINIGSVSVVPLPASAPMFGAALLALGAIGYGVKRKKAAATA